jgi:hypothetical protein
MTGWVRWGAFAFLWLFTWISLLIIVPGLMMPTVIAVSAGAALLWPWRRMILRARSAKAAELIRASVPAEAIAVDDFAELERQPDGAVVSLVGWVRARDQLPQQVAGGPCIGLALPCQQRYPGVMETLADFDLADEAGRAILVQVAGGRMLAETNVTLSDANARMLLIGSLDLPMGAVVTGWDAFVLRDGDPVMVVGFKQTAMDPTQGSLRGPPARATIGSLDPKPLLIFALAAERRGQATAVSNVS